MKPCLTILACRTYRAEFEAVLKQEGWDDVRLTFMLQACSHPEFRQAALRTARSAGVPDENQVLMLGGCFVGGARAGEKEHLPGLKTRVDNCFYLLVNRVLVTHLIEQGAYLVTPGWLNEWREHFSLWGFEQENGRLFFHEFVRRLVLLDTGVDPGAEGRLRELGEFLDLPVETLPVGLDLLRLNLTAVVAEWRTRQSLAENQDVIAQARRSAADYAMTLDVLTSLTRAMTEEQAVQEIADLFTMLISSGSVNYYSVVGGEMRPAPDHTPPANFSALQDWLGASADEYMWMDDETGFALRLVYKQQVLGVLAVSHISLPQYRQQYLNLSLSIARLCGLAISNARIYQQLQAAEAEARRQKDVAETMRQVLRNLVAERGSEELLQNILAQLRRVLPYSSAAVFLLEGGTLNVRARADQNGAAAAPAAPLEAELGCMSTSPCIAENVQLKPAYARLAGGEHIRGWLGIPLALRGEAIGCLSIGSTEVGAYGEAEARLAQTFADEAAIAIENARLFQEIQHLAVTDGLTGIYNRRHFFALAAPEFRRSQRYRRPLSAVMLDLDHFKLVNDTYGHAAGDQALVEVAACLRSRLRSADVTARYGGEEFILLLPETTLASALAFAERLRGMIEVLEIADHEHRFHVTASLGVAAADETCDSLETLLYRADEALYRAKGAGRNCVAVWKE